MLKKLAIASVAIGLIAIGGVGTNYFIQADKANQTAIATQKANQAMLDEFYALNSKLDVGLTYLQYGEELSQLKASLDKFGRLNPSSLILPSLNNSLSSYIDGLYLWKKCIDSCKESKELFVEYADNPALNDLSNRSDPEMGKVAKLVKDYGMWTSVSSTDTEDKFRYITLGQSEALTKIWAKAKLDINTASNTQRDK
jgi:hypothetical protein